MKFLKTTIIILLLCGGILLPLIIEANNFFMSGYKVLFKYPYLDFVIPGLSWIILIIIFIKKIGGKKK